MFLGTYPLSFVKIKSVAAEILWIWTNVTGTKMVSGTYLVSLVKIGSVIAEIFLIWTNVTRTNVALTYVSVAIGICCRCSQEPFFKVSSKSDQ